MDFQDFLKYVPNFAQAKLPAFEAHIKMAPLERIDALKNGIFDNKKSRKAAVMMLFYPKNGRTHLVLIVRSSYEGTHSSQIAFPGGKFEPEDAVFANTALRETHEEIGILPRNIEIIKPFTELYVPPSNFMVHPFLGISREEISFIPDPNEVANIIELPLSVFLSDEIIISAEMATSYAGKITVPAFKIEEHIVWGATAMMLSELKEVLKEVLG
ncbi:NUDIX hydrolase [Flavobacterium gawalongense]|uniref:CoA pyrophosphatase n=1 Tax=Flavobacterium gawalongense TaxID=2594432 RepID=A0A553BHE6_9FLAO|nr:CoA pyrophosphatase [Flavobacterium gawalongense]TRX03345.1 CoA pyrophosphatase [Flavobacterium gawalongense]TRX04052.1 CoA pyrophosphatase [Flavobacterium gawalongense]TRX07652.1 CoA pyrophosphatase [Flavobacterium gawalongense]TRX07835.1 CoA pyrophosphatase [Flavobacterium gawalongense]TRX23572.1 CoA pyrophosphatase [Flavobacterium gawalongense]